MPTLAPDEIDTIGRARGNSVGADSDEREQGLLQLLVEMDGFDSKREKVKMRLSHRFRMFLLARDRQNVAQIHASVLCLLS